MIIRQKVKIFVFLLLFNTISYSQTIENGWKDIKPLLTNKVIVEKQLGEPERISNGFHYYRTDDAFIEVNYSTAPCEGNRYEGDEYNVAKDVVLNYRVGLNKMILLSDFEFDREKYVKDTSGDLTSHADYRYEDAGVSIGVYIQEETEYVTDLSFKPSKSQEKLFGCKENKIKN